jgi:CheY-like chemotaxis protein
MDPRGAAFFGGEGKACGRSWCFSKPVPKIAFELISKGQAILRAAAGRPKGSGDTGRKRKKRSGKAGKLVNRTVATILCVDDEANQLILRKLLLENAGYRVLTADSFRSALAMFQSHTIDLAVVDYWMTGGNGVQLASELRRHQESLPIVILSAYSELPGETIGIADAWITKGGASQILLAKIEELLARALVRSNQDARSRRRSKPSLDI